MSVRQLKTSGEFIFFDTHLACAIVILVHRTVVGKAVSQYLQSSTGMQHPENIGYQPTFLMAQPQRLFGH